MGIFESISNLASGAGKSCIPVRLEPGENEVYRAVACIRPGLLSSVGGDLVVTNQRIIFTPLNLKDAAALLAWSLSKAGAPTGTTQLVNGLVRLVGNPVDVAKSDRLTSSVETGSEPRLLKAPTLVLIDSLGERTELGILAGRLVPNISDKNRGERDRVVDLIAGWILGSR